MTLRNRLSYYSALNILAGIFTSVGSLAVYWAFTSPLRFFTTELLRTLKWFSYVTIILMIVGFFVSALGIKQFLAGKRIEGEQYVSPPATVVLANVLGIRKYLLALVFSASAYGIFYAAVSSIIVYRPMENFSEEYLATIPSIVPTVCCDRLGFIPVFTVYLTEHLGLLIIPANIILLILVSGLVGLNVALAIYTYEHRPKQARADWLGGLGAATGLFTACPTCAGLFLGNMIQTAGNVAIAAVLAAYQPLFVAVTFPALLASTFVISRRLRSALYGTCKVIAR